MGRALSKLNAAEMNLLKNFNPSTASEVLAPCVTQITHISCVDDSKDFCVGSTIYVGLGVLFAIFLPGIVRALGNLVFYRVSNNTQNNITNCITGANLSHGFRNQNKPRPTLQRKKNLSCFTFASKPGLRCLHDHCRALPHLSQVAKPNSYNNQLFSIFVLSSTYHREFTTGEVVQDNQEAKKDATFKSVQLQKSAEAFSESVVQFAIQLTFLSVFTWISQAEVMV